MANNNWCTPEWIVDIIHDYKPITLDPCTNEYNPTRAECFFTPLTNGLSERWDLQDDDMVFMNPPFGRGQMRKWTDKFLTEMYDPMDYLNTHNAEAICLFKLDTTHATDLLFTAADLVIIPKKRVNYEDKAGFLVTGADFPSVLTYQGQNALQAKRHFLKTDKFNVFSQWSFYG